MPVFLPDLFLYISFYDSFSAPQTSQSKKQGVVFFHECSALKVTYKLYIIW
ncbi:hypothetical protein [uncultured Chryseobacterium sp.]|uniref:hypothetical protein n=1 Tax=uncultured Chryseobacterium sp. TaxID=259322 RepID=UPI0025DB9754|nr:hypothetical protein [uncultured Chryseobacterium sp.]